MKYEKDAINGMENYIANECTWTFQYAKYS